MKRRDFVQMAGVAAVGVAIARPNVVHETINEYEGWILPRESAAAHLRANMIGLEVGDLFKVEGGGEGDGVYRITGIAHGKVSTVNVVSFEGRRRWTGVAL